MPRRRSEDRISRACDSPTHQGANGAILETCRRLARSSGLGGFFLGLSIYSWMWASTMAPQ